MLQYGKNNFDAKRLVVTPIKKEQTANNITYYRVQIRYKDDAGNLKPLDILSSKGSSWGIKVFRKDNKPNEVVQSLTMSLSTYDNQTGPTAAQKWFIDTVKEISNIVKKSTINDKNSILNDKQKILVDLATVFAEKSAKNDSSGGYAPVMNPKLFIKIDKDDPKSIPKILTPFTDDSDTTMDATTLIDTECSIAMLVCIDSLYLGSSASMQFKAKQVICLGKIVRQPIVKITDVPDYTPNDKSIEKSVFDDDDDDYIESSSFESALLRDNQKRKLKTDDDRSGKLLKRRREDDGTD